MVRRKVEPLKHNDKKQTVYYTGVIDVLNTGSKDSLDPSLG